MKPRLDAPPAGQPGSVDWTMTTLFGSRDEAIMMIESLVAGQGANADEKWIQFILLYRQWEIEFKRGDILEVPTFNQVCHALDFDAQTFINGVQIGLTDLMKGISKLKASIAAPKVVDRLVSMAQSDTADVKEIELALKVGGIIEENKGVNINVNQQQAVLLKGERERMKTPLRQFTQLTTDIDTEVRRTDD